MSGVEGFGPGPVGQVIAPCDLEREKPKHWIEIELLGEDDSPIAFEEYEILLPDGSTIARGYLDESGWARIDGLEDAGNCQVTFPRLDREAWVRHPVEAQKGPRPKPKGARR